MFWKTLKTSKIGQSFMVVKGERLGELLVLVETKKDTYCFVSYPLNIIRHYDVNEFETLRKDDIIKFVEKIPRKIFKDIERFYVDLKKQNRLDDWDGSTIRSVIKNHENFNYRREQPSMESTMGSKQRSRYKER